MALVPAINTFNAGDVVSATLFNANFTTFKTFLEGGNLDTNNLATKWSIERLAVTLNMDGGLAGANFTHYGCAVLPASIELDKLIAATVTVEGVTGGTVSLDVLQGAPGTYDGSGGSAGATSILSGVATCPFTQFTATAPGFAVANVAAGQEVIFKLTGATVTTAASASNFSAVCELWTGIKLKAL
tara:strand:+ start:10198 stop:10755 length:558 start_codon:yes stop_codon:yes gene_type:complete